MADYHNFYKLSDGQEKSALVVASKSYYFTDEFDLLTCNEIPFITPTFVPRMGKKMYDFIPTTYAVLFLISKKITELLRENQFSGWQTYPLKIYDRNNDEIENYFGLMVNGKCGPIINEMSEVTIISTPSGKSKRAWRGLYFGLKTYDGSVFLCQKIQVLFLSLKELKMHLRSIK